MSKIHKCLQRVQSLGAFFYMYLCMSKNYFTRNVPNWQPSANDYRLVFRSDSEGVWREVSNNVPAFAGRTLAEWLAANSIEIPEGCQFCRIRRGGEFIEYRDFGSKVIVDFTYMDCI